MSVKAKTPEELRAVAIDTLTAILLRPNEQHAPPLADAQILAAKTMLAHGINEDIVLETLAAGAAGQRGFSYGHKVQAAAILLQHTEVTK